MEQNEIPFGEDFKDLRTKTEQEFLNGRLKSTPFGGYRKNDVLNLITELRGRELQAGETYTGRIHELTAALESLQKTQAALKEELRGGSEQNAAMRAKYEELAGACQALKGKAESAEAAATGYLQKCTDYEAQIKLLKTDYEEVQSAKKYRALYDELSESYRQLAESHEKTEKEAAMLGQENAELKSRNDRLNSENELLSQNLSELTSVTRKGGLALNSAFGTYSQKHRFLLGSLLTHAQETLKCLKELEEKENELTAEVNDNLKAFK